MCNPFTSRAVTTYMQINDPEKEDRFTFWKRIVLVFVFFFVTPLTLVLSAISLSTLAQADESSDTAAYLVSMPESGLSVYASLPASVPSVGGEVVADDARAGLLKQYLASWNSELEPHAGYIIDVSDKYELDYRLTTAIAQKESGLCRAIPEGSYNCWGWGIHSQGSLGFDSYEQGIETVSSGLKEFYIDQGYETVEEIMSKYAHPDSTTWADGVLHYMGQIQ